MWLTHLAGAHGRFGHPFEGLSRLAEAGEIIETTDERHHEAEVYRLQGDLMNATGDQEAAERSYHRAIAAAERQNAKGLEIRAATRARAPTPVLSSRQSTAGSPKASTRRSCKMPRCS